MDRVRSVMLLLVCAAWLACSGSEDPAPAADPAGEGEPPRIYAVNYPLKYFAERIGGDLFQVEFPAPGDVDPAFWNPDADTILDRA